MKRVLLVCAVMAASFVLAAEESADVRKGRVIEQLRQMMQPTSIAMTPVDDDPLIEVVPGAEGTSTLIYRCRYTRSKDLISGVESVISRAGMVEESEEQNMLVINDVSEKMDELRNIVLALDQPVPQILVEAMVIEVYASDDLQKELTFNYNKADFGVNGSPYNSIGGTMELPVSGSQPSVFDFSPYSMGVAGAYNRMHVFLEWLETTSDTKILSSPNLSVSRGRTASIVTGDELPIQTTSTTGNTVNNDIKYKRTGIRLNVTPSRINNETVHLHVNPEVSTVTRYESFNNTRTPVISVRNVDTELSLRDGEVIMLGGLYSTENLKTTKKVPILGDIPLLGWFFRSNQNSSQVKQLVFFMKVNIVHSGSDTFSDMEKTAESMGQAGSAIESSDVIFPNRSASE